MCVSDSLTSNQLQSAEFSLGGRGTWYLLCWSSNSLLTWTWQFIITFKKLATRSYTESVETSAYFHIFDAILPSIPEQKPVCSSHLPHACYMYFPSHLPRNSSFTSKK